MTRTIDPRYYGVNGYGNIPSYNIPYKATGHLIEYPKGEALCGAEARTLHERAKDSNGPLRKGAWASICKRCLKVAADEGLVEWTMPTLRKGDCPVLSERAGKRHKHIINPYRPRCKKCPVPTYGHKERCDGRHRTFGRCYSCGYEDLERHYCDFIVGRAAGISTDFGSCDRRAYEEREYAKEFFEGRTLWGWLCGMHTPEAIQKRKDERDAKYRAMEERWSARDKQRDDENEALDIAIEMAQWIALNRDLAAEDEWLGKIADRMAANDTIQKGLT